MELWQSVTPRSVFLNSFTLHMLGPAPLCEVMQETQKGSRARCSVKALQDPSSGHVWFVAHGKGFLRDCCSPKQHKNMMLLSRCAQHRGKSSQQILFLSFRYLEFLNSVGFFYCPEHLKALQPPYDRKEQRTLSYNDFQS